MKEQNNNNEDIEPKYRKHFGVMEIRQHPGDWSIGAFITHDSWFGEMYLLINLFKWEICIGLIVELVDEI